MRKRASRDAAKLTEFFTLNLKELVHGHCNALVVQNLDSKLSERHGSVTDDNSATT